MKKISLLILFCSALNIFAQHISKETALIVAENFLKNENCLVSIDSTTEYARSGKTLFYIINATPNAYVIVSANRNLPPVLGWSKNSLFKASSFFLPIIGDYCHSYRSTIRKHFSDTQKRSIQEQWDRWIQGNKGRIRSQSWPAEGSTTTGGWISTRWTQVAPYNRSCPLDPITMTRSYAGCPAIVMGQILNYLKTTQNTRFQDSDDYTHNYPDRIYHIDDDADSLDFPSFPKLNLLLDSIDLTYENQSEISEDLAAALIFASGTACTQVYTSSGSGTFAVIQAYNAYKRFGFENCLLYETTDESMYVKLIDNLKNGYPAHLALVDAEWSTGHNVIVDGYRDDGYFHINFGWGGQSDGWWLIPDSSFPYSLGVLEGIILDIIPSSSKINENQQMNTITFYPNPTFDSIHLKPIPENPIEYAIFNINGQEVQSGITSGEISVSQLIIGTYIIQFRTKMGIQTSKLIIQQ